MIKTPNKLIIEGNVLNLIKGISEKPVASTILDGDREYFPLKIGATQVYSLLPLYSTLYPKFWTVIKKKNSIHR